MKQRYIVSLANQPINDEWADKTSTAND